VIRHSAAYFAQVLLLLYKLLSCSYCCRDVPALPVVAHSQYYLVLVSEHVQVNSLIARVVELSAIIATTEFFVRAIMTPSVLGC